MKVEARGWEPPGGQVEPGEDLVGALRRETLEETGVAIDVGSLVSISSNLRAGSEKVILTFLCSPLSTAVRPQGEALEAGWFAATEATERVTHPAQAARLRDGLSYDGASGVLYRAYRTQPYELISEVRLAGP